MDDGTLSDRVARNLPDSDIQEIVESAKKDGIMGDALYDTLVRSGAALGIDAAQFALFKDAHDFAEQQLKMAREFDKMMQSAAGNDRLFQMLRDSRDGLVRHIRLHLDNLRRADAMAGDKEFGIPCDAFLSKDHSDAFIATVNKAGVFVNQMAFFGWIILQEDKNDQSHEAQCGCMGCLMRLSALNAHVPPSAIIHLAVQRFGSLDKAAEGYIGSRLKKHWRTFEQIEERFQLDETTVSQEAIAMASDAFARIFRGKAHPSE